MPRGFVGPPAASYLPKIEEALQIAAEVHNINPFFNLRNWAVSPPALPPRPNAVTPHPSGTAMTGSHTTGTGSVRNIVVGIDLYLNILRKVIQTDDKISDQMYSIAKEIVDICGTSYVLPQAAPACMEVSASVDNSLVGFRSLTDASIAKMLSFKDEILNIK